MKYIYNHKTKNLAEIIYSNIEDPSKEAFIFKGGSITYDELCRKSRKIASLFINQGIKENNRILIFLNDTPELIFSFLASIQIGAIPILLNPKSKSRLISHYLTSSKASTVICERENHENIVEAVKTAGANALIIERDRIEISAKKNTSENTGCSLSMADSMNPCEDFFYEQDRAIIWQYTSGTTGLPKAVTHTLEGIIHSNESYAKNVLDISKDSKIYSTARMFFGYGLGNSVYFTLLNGATAYIDERWPDTETIFENLSYFKPTHFFSVPTLYGKILENSDKYDHLIRNINYSVSAGSPLHSNVFKKWKSSFSAEIIDGIGATEVGHIFISNQPGKASPGITGKPIDGYEVKIVSEDNSEVECGFPGELLVKGPSVSLGYAFSSENSIDKFIDGWYRTGDKFVKDYSGAYRYLGRVDDIFKSKGRWVHPQEIEDFLRSSLNWVDDVAIIPSEDTDCSPVICLVKTKDFPVVDYIKKEILDYISSIFGGHCKPTEYRELNNFPRNENGKILRKNIIKITPIFKCSLNKPIMNEAVI